MKERYKKYLKINIIPVIFITTSFIFTTFAWFAYSGLKNVETEVDVKAWYIELTKSGDKVSNNIVITLDDIGPGMETLDEIVNIQNKGDSEARLNYKILRARILDTEFTEETVGLEEELSHDYPFHLNIDLQKNYLNAGGDESKFEVSLSWPLDSGNDNLDSTWGMQAYEFEQQEKAKKQEDPNYEIRPAIQVVISLTAEQYIESNDEVDPNFQLGQSILYDVVSNRKCFTLSNTCLKTTVIDTNNKISDNTVTLLPSLYEEYSSSTYDNYEQTLEDYTKYWTAPRRGLKTEDILKVVSKDVINTIRNSDNLSPQIVGLLKNDTRINNELQKARTNDSYYTFISENFSYLAHSGCFWSNTEFDASRSFAFGRLNEIRSEIYPTSKTSECKVVPVILAPKSNL